MGMRWFEQAFWTTLFGAATGCVGGAPAPPVAEPTGDTASSTTTGSHAATDPPGDSSTTAWSETETTGDLTAAPTSSSGGRPATTGGTALLEISDGPLFDFGDIDQAASAIHLFTVLNVGDGPATGLSGGMGPGAFEYTGGAFPGISGTCVDLLDPADDCQVEVSFTPTTIGLFDGTLSLTHDTDGEAAVALTGAGMGQSDNLLVNPGGEDLGSPPMGWSNSGPGDWVAGQFPPVIPFAGNACIGSDLGPSDETFVLEQAAVVGAWASTIDAGMLRISFVGLARSQDLFNNDYRLQLDYLDAMDQPLVQWSTAWETSDQWEQYDDSRYAPVGTRTIVVSLNCRKTAGNVCDTFYDELNLHATYP